MVNWKTKYLAMKLKYINSKKGGSFDYLDIAYSRRYLYQIEEVANKVKETLKEELGNNIIIIGIQSITPKATLNGNVQNPDLLYQFSTSAPETIYNYIRQYIQPRFGNVQIILLSQGDKKTDERAGAFEDSGVAETIQQVANLLNKNNINVGIYGITNKSIEKLEQIFHPIKILGSHNVDKSLVNKEILTSYYPNIDGWFNRIHVPKAAYAKDQLFSNLLADYTFKINPQGKNLESNSLSYHVTGLNHIQI